MNTTDQTSQATQDKLVDTLHQALEIANVRDGESVEYKARLVLGLVAIAVMGLTKGSPQAANSKGLRSLRYLILEQALTWVVPRLGRNMEAA